MVPQHSEGRSVGVIYTGGTFGMVASERGYVPSEDLPERAQAALEQQAPAGLPAIRWLDTGWPPLNSGDLVPRFWFELAEVIAAARDQHEGFVVIHGTDTLAYTGSALSFLLAGLDRPVVVTGATRPLGERGSDAAGHLVDALRAAGSPQCREVTVAFGQRLLRANRATKRQGTREQPFDSPCWPALAQFDHDIHWQPVEPLPAVTADRLPRAEWRDTRVAIVPSYPGIDGAIIRALRDTGIGGLILEGYAAGIGPGGDADFVAAIEECVHAGVVCGAVSQSRQGYVRLGKYAVSTPLAEAGLVGGADMTREAALAKMHVLLAREADPTAVASAFGEDLCGELTPAQ